MKKIDSDGSLLCDIQARAFELSVELSECPSTAFIKSFMLSDYAELFDNCGIILTNLSPQILTECITDDLKKYKTEPVKYQKDVMYWIGYIYRYFSYTYEIPSARCYKMISPRELKEVYEPYHSLDPSLAIDRILEAKGISLDTENELKRQFAIFKRLRSV